MATYIVGPFVLRSELLVLTCDGERLALGQTVVATLLALVELRGSVAGNDQLQRRIWPAGFVDQRNLSQNIYILRKTFRAHGIENAIELVPRRGYRLRLPVAVLPEAITRTPLLRFLTPFGIAIAALTLFLTASNAAHVSSFNLSSRAPLSAAGARAYQIGLYYFDKRTRAGVRRSLDYFGRTIDANPTDARGYAAMANANVVMGDYCYGTHRPEVYFARAKAYVKTASLMQPNAPETLAADAFIKLHEHRIGEAREDLDQAIREAPDYADAHEWRGIAYFLSKNVSMAARELQIAQRLDALSISTDAWLARVALAQRRDRQAALYARMALELDATRNDARSLLASAQHGGRIVAHNTQAGVSRNHPTWASIEDALGVTTSSS